MHTIEDEKNIKEYEKYILRNGIDRSVIDAYCEASKIMLCGRKDREYGLKVSTRAKELIFEYIKSITNGADFNWLETQSQKNKQSYDILDKYYDLLLYEAPYILDSYILYIEKTDLRKKDFTSLEEKHSNKLPISCRNLKMENLTNCLFTCRQGLVRVR